MKGKFIKVGVYLVIMFFLILILPKFDIHPAIVYFCIFTILILAAFLPKFISKSLKANYKNYISLEEIPAEFEKLYENLYHNNIYSLESMRKQVKWKIVFQYSLTVLSFIGFLFGQSDYVIISEEFDIIITVICLIGFVISIIFLCLGNKLKRKYIETYKKEIVSSFIKLINNQLEYKPFDLEIFRTQHDYKQAEFDKKSFNRFAQDDYIEGFLDDETFIKMSDLHIQKRTGSGESKHIEEIFHGIFAHTRCNKDIGTYIKISKNKFKILQKQDRVEMDSEEFEKYFDIYSGNKIIAMQLLTSDIMEFLIAFHTKYELNYEIVFRNNVIYMRFFTGAMFEPKIFGSSMDKQLLFVYFCIMKFIVEILKKINKTLQEIEI